MQHVNFVKFLGTPFLQNTSGRLLLKIDSLQVFENFLENFRTTIFQIISRWILLIKGLDLLKKS